MRMLLFHAAMSEKTQSVFSIIIKEFSRGWGGQFASAISGKGYGEYFMEDKRNEGRASSLE